MVENKTLESEKWVIEFLSENPFKVNLLKRTKIWRIENYMKFIGTLNLGSLSIWCSDWLRGLSLFLIGGVITLKMFLVKFDQLWWESVRYPVYGTIFNIMDGMSVISEQDWTIQMTHLKWLIIWLILNESFSPMTQKFMCLSWQRKKTMPIEDSKSSHVPVR